MKSLLAENKSFSIIFVLVLVISLVVPFHFGTEKSGFHVDEYYSYGLSNSHYQSFADDYNQWLEPEYYEDYVMTDTEDRFSYGSVYHNQIDDTHPPLYYMILHTVSSFFPNQFSKWIGLSINLIVYFLILIVSFKFILMVTGKKWLSLFSIGLFGLSIGGISAFLFIRMYLFLSLLQLLVAYYQYKYVHTSKRKDLSLAFLLTVLGGLTHYYYYIYAGILTFVSIVYMLAKRKPIKNIFFLGLSQIASLFLAFGLFPHIITHLFNSGRGQGVTSSLGNIQNLSNIREFFTLITDHLFGGMGLLLIGVIIVGFMALFLRDKSKLAKLLYLFIPVVASITLIAWVSPYTSARYVFPFYPLTSLLISLALISIFTYLFKNWPFFKGAALFLTIAVVSLIGFTRFVPDYLYLNMREVYPAIEEYSDYPVIVVSENDYPQQTLWHLNELRQFEKIYPMHTVDNNFSQHVRDIPTEPVNDGVVVFYHRDVLRDESNNTVETIYDHFGFDTSDWVSRNRRFEIYFVS